MACEVAYEGHELRGGPPALREPTPWAAHDRPNPAASLQAESRGGVPPLGAQPVAAAPRCGTPPAGPAVATQPARSPLCGRSWPGCAPRAAPPRQLRLHLVPQMPFFARSAGPCAETWVLLGAVVAQCTPRLEQLSILQASWRAALGAPLGQLYPRHANFSQCSALLTRSSTCGKTNAMQDYPGILPGADGVHEGMRVQYLPPLSHWLLPCRRLERLEVIAPHVRLAPHTLARLPALQRLSLQSNIVKVEVPHQLVLEPLAASQLASSSLTSLQLDTSYSVLQVSGAVVDRNGLTQSTAV